MSKVRKKNQIRRNLILRALRDEGELSLTELKKVTGISLPIITTLVSGLKEEGFLIEVEDKQPLQAGRPPVFVRLNGEAGYFIGVDIGRTKTHYTVLDLSLNLVLEVRRPSVNLNNGISTLDELYQEIRTLIGAESIPYEKVFGLGFSLSGLVQGPLGISNTYLNFDDVPLKPLLEEKFQKPVIIENDAKAMAKGELRFGAAVNRQNVLCINIGWGLGMGLILNGKLYYGSHFYAGEFGHLQINPKGHLCYCGKRGCLEMYASGKAIAQNARAKLNNGAETILKQQAVDLEKLSAKQIIDAANQGDQFCIEILEEAVEYLGFGIAQLINIFNPELVIFGGRIAMMKPFILNKIISAAQKHSLTYLNESIEFATSQLGPKAGSMGVAAMSASDLFEVDDLNPTAFV